MRPVHPGEILREEFLSILNWGSNPLAERLCIPVGIIDDIVHERQGITANVALRLARLFETTPEFWMNLQQNYELKKAAFEIGDAIDQVVPLSPQDR